MDPRRYTPPKTQDPKTAVVTSPPHGQATRRCPNLHSWGGRVPRALSPPISNSVWVRCVDRVCGGAGLSKHAPGDTGGVRHPQFFWLVRQRFRGAPACMLSPPTGDGDTEVTPCGTTHPHPRVWSTTLPGLVSGFRSRLWPAEGLPLVITLSSHPLSESAPNEREARAKQVLHPRRGFGPGSTGSGPAPPSNLVDNTGEGGGVRRAAKFFARHVEGAR